MADRLPQFPERPPGGQITLKDIKNRISNLAKITNQNVTSFNKIAPIVNRLGKVTAKLSSDIISLNTSLDGVNPPQLGSITESVKELTGEIENLERLLNMSGAGSGTSGSGTSGSGIDLGSIPPLPPVVESPTGRTQGGGAAFTHPAAVGGYKWTRSASKSKSKTRKGKKGKKAKKSKKSKTRSKRR